MGACSGQKRLRATRCCLSTLVELHDSTVFLVMCCTRPRVGEWAVQGAAHVLLSVAPKAHITARKAVLMIYTNVRFPSGECKKKRKLALRGAWPCIMYRLGYEHHTRAVARQCTEMTTSVTQTESHPEGMQENTRLGGGNGMTCSSTSRKATRKHP